MKRIARRPKNGSFARPAPRCHVLPATPKHQRLAGLNVDSGEVKARTHPRQAGSTRSNLPPKRRRRSAADLPARPGPARRQGFCRVGCPGQNPRLAAATATIAASMGHSSANLPGGRSASTGTSSSPWPGSPPRRRIHLKRRITAGCRKGICLRLNPASGSEQLVACMRLSATRHNVFHPHRCARRRQPNFPSALSTCSIITTASAPSEPARRS